ncbi:N-acetyltransferase [Saccharomonospora xinjiangensis]|uniref:GNAT family N-acetyltransferase n=1 Tax=Saccharomonospora xinjiangensis TaxID=75294 RepID=UPI00106F0FB0|nr:N-acetyltransferase [Saccharomonospora xinjiangensis]QBQ62407.1 hypothetical protein EYD13_20370 [Saccharomonospora xinjiangensis]
MNTVDWKTRQETSADVAAVHAVHLAAFETSLEAKLVDTLRTDPAWIDEFSMVVEGPDGLAGHALLTRCHIGDVPALGLGPVGVLPEWQSKGAGSAAIVALLREAEQAGESFVVVLGHPPYYPRFGFERASTYGISLPIEVPDDAFLVRSLDGTRPPSGVVRYAAPFGV